MEDGSVMELSEDGNVNAELPSNKFISVENLILGTVVEHPERGSCASASIRRILRWGGHCATSP